MTKDNTMFVHGSLFAIVAGLASILYGAPDAHAEAFEAQCSGDFDGEYFTEKPSVSSDLCETGAPSGSLEGDGSEGNPWKWHCYDPHGNEGEKCEAFINLCGNGEVDAGEQCDGHAGCDSSCKMTAQCGSANDAVLESAPSSNLCSTGNPSGSLEGDGSESNPWKWHCFDFAGNAGERCTATQIVEVVEEEVEEVIVVEEEVVEEENDVVDPGGEVVEEVIEEEEIEEVAPVEVAACSTGDYSDIKGFIYHDDNRNGTYDSGEVGIEDVTVELYLDGKELEEDETDDEGKFRFEDYAPGRYVIDVHGGDRQLEGFTIVSESDNNRNERDSINLKCDNNHTGTLFGYDTGTVSVSEGFGGNGSRPTTLAQTGGSFWNFLLGLFR